MRARVTVDPKVGARERLALGWRAGDGGVRARARWVDADDILSFARARGRRVRARGMALTRGLWARARAKRSARDVGASARTDSGVLSSFVFVVNNRCLLMPLV